MFSLRNDSTMFMMLSTTYEMLGACVELSLFIIAVFLVFRLIRSRSGTNIPPTLPWNLPLIGNLPWIAWSVYRSGVPVYDYLRRLKYIHGNMYTLNIFGQYVIITNDFKSTKDAFNNSCISDRPQLIKGGQEGCQKGIILSSGNTWLHQRRFTQTTLRSFGVGKNTFANNIAVESSALIREFSLLDGAPFDPKHLLVNAVSNVICSVVFGKRFEYSDEKFQYFLNLTHRQVELPSRVLPHLYLSFLRYFPSKQVDELISNCRQIGDFIDDIIQKHHQDFDPDNLRDYIDVYINELRLNSSKLTELREENMKHTISQLFTAGTDTTALSLRWGLLYMITNPCVQKRVQQELDEIVGRDRLPVISDKPSLPYTQATLLEIQRMASTARIGTIHSCSKTTSLCGYTIPQGAYVMPNFWAIHRDPDVWDEPNKFKPERFIDEMGCLRQAEGLIPFSIGRRKCLGDSLARMELFLFFTYILHHFSLQKSIDMTDISGLDVGRTPKDFKLCAVKR